MEAVSDKCSLMTSSICPSGAALINSEEQVMPNDVIFNSLNSQKMRTIIVM